ncbi:SpaA isopeptide-forming pilin-related protein [Ignavigranum ruoffiae]|uniref:SpaA isopeptide-forming pilin-related protein n=1 Tax=Ignavigranum ruoffiae TaxID=89093 RepID=UPI003B0034FD
MKISHKLRKYLSGIILLLALVFIPLTIIKAQDSESNLGTENTTMDNQATSEETETESATQTETSNEELSSESDVIPTEPKLLTVYKYGSLTKYPLSGAQFELYGLEPEIYSSLETNHKDTLPKIKETIPFLTKFMDSMYVKVFAQETNADIPAGNILLDTFYTDENGKFTTYLSPGTYYLREIIPQSGIC